MRKLLGLCALGLLSLCLPAIAHADDFAFNFSGQTPGDVGSSMHDYNAGTTGYHVSGHAFQTYVFNGQNYAADKNLYGKTGTDPIETGLGIAGTADHEIGVNQFIQLDTANLKAGAFTSMTLWIGSVQPTEAFSIYASDTSLISPLGGGISTFSLTPATKVYSFTGTQSAMEASFQADLSKRYYAVTATNTDVLIEDKTFVTKPAAGGGGGGGQGAVPESGSLLLISGGLLPIGVILRRNRAI